MDSKKLAKKLILKNSEIDTLLHIRLGRNLKRLRLSKKLSLNNLSKLICVSSYSLKKIEKGEKEKIDLVTLEKIRFHLGSTFGELLD